MLQSLYGSHTQLEMCEETFVFHFIHIEWCFKGSAVVIQMDLIMFLTCLFRWSDELNSSTCTWSLRVPVPKGPGPFALHSQLYLTLLLKVDILYNINSACMCFMWSHRVLFCEHAFYRKLLFMDPLRRQQRGIHASKTTVPANKPPGLSSSQVNFNYMAPNQNRIFYFFLSLDCTL